MNYNKFFFTAGGADANNIIISSILKTNKKGHIITSKIEHPSVLDLIKSYENIFDVTYLNVDEYGFIDQKMLEDSLRDNTVLVSIATVNSELGTIQDIEKICNIVKTFDKNIFFHTDFVQGLGHVQLDFSKIAVDALSISSHKIYGPKGIGAMYIADIDKFNSVIKGSNKENGLVPRTIANELVLAFLKAMELIDYTELIKMQELKEYAIDKFLKLNARINSPFKSVPSILNIALKNVKAEIVLNYLSSKGIYVSSGSACSSKKPVSEVIKQLNIGKEYENGVLRISFSNENDKEDIDSLIQAINEILKMMM